MLQVEFGLLRFCSTATFDNFCLFWHHYSSPIPANIHIWTRPSFELYRLLTDCRDGNWFLSIWCKTFMWQSEISRLDEVSFRMCRLPFETARRNWVTDSHGIDDIEFVWTIVREKADANSHGYDGAPNLSYLRACKVTVFFIDFSGIRCCGQNHNIV